MADVRVPWTRRVDLLLRGDRRTVEDGPWALGPTTSLALIVLGTALVGAAVGANDPSRPGQILISAVKLPCLLLASGLVTLPFLVVLHAATTGAASGIQDGLRAWRTVLAAEVGLTMSLLSLAPLLLLGPASGLGYDLVRATDLAIFAIALLHAGVLMRRLLPSGETGSRARWIMAVWLTVHAFTAIQLAWMLRPFVGSPDLPPRWFREDPFTNAYLEIAAILWRIVAA